eukprot:SAG11_NODE_3725_length_2260_cov_6.142527_2_plen_212_part_01
MRRRRAAGGELVIAVAAVCTCLCQESNESPPAAKLAQLPAAQQLAPRRGNRSQMIRMYRFRPNMISTKFRGVPGINTVVLNLFLVPGNRSQMIQQSISPKYDLLLLLRPYCDKCSTTVRNTKFSIICTDSCTLLGSRDPLQTEIYICRFSHTSRTYSCTGIHIPGHQPGATEHCRTVLVLVGFDLHEPGRSCARAGTGRSSTPTGRRWSACR